MLYSCTALQWNSFTIIVALGLGLCANFAGNMNQFNMNQGGGDAMAAASNSAQQQLGFIERLQRQQQEIQQQQMNLNQGQNQDGMFMSRKEWHMTGGDSSQMPQMNMGQIAIQARTKKSEPAVGCEKTAVLELLPFLRPNDKMGARFRASYILSFGTMFQLPPVLTSEEYCLQTTNMSMPKYDVAVLQAAQFAELAVGAMVDGDKDKMFELTNASILCLQDSVKEPVHPNCRFELSRALFLHALLRSFNGDMERCFKYRRASMNTLAKLDVRTILILV